LERALSATAALAGLLALLAPAGPAAAGAALGKQRLSGRYALGDRERSAAAIRAAVDRATERMALLRGVARARLYETSEPAPRLELGFPEGQIRVAQAGEAPVVTPDDGRPAAWTSRFGDTTTVVQTYRRGKLVQTFRGAMGSLRTDVYTLSPDARRLSVRSVITSAFLPEAVEFEVIYDREQARTLGGSP